MGASALHLAQRLHSVYITFHTLLPVSFPSSAEAPSPRPPYVYSQHQSFNSYLSQPYNPSSLPPLLLLCVPSFARRHTDAMEHVYGALSEFEDSGIDDIHLFVEVGFGT